MFGCTFELYIIIRTKMISGDNTIMRWFRVVYCCWYILVVEGATATPPSTSLPEPFPRIAGYLPMTLVTDYNAIDLDVQDMDMALAGDLIDEAMKIYEDGGNTRSYAVVKLGMELHQTLNANAIVSSTKNHTTTSNGKTIYVTDLIVGTVMYTAKKGTRELSILYETKPDQSHYCDCRVGARQHPLLDGCFAPNGIITIEEWKMSMPYVYNPVLNNKNDRSLQTFSTKAASKMKPCDKCEYWFYFDQFYQFYGVTDYADKIIQAAAAGTAVQLENANFDFTNMNYEGRGVAIHVAVVAMNLAIGIIRQLELAWSQCQSCATRACEELTANDVDGAWAMYTGSLEGPDGTGSGKLWYAIADTECQYFKTCGVTGDEITGVANVNIRLMEYFQTYQQNVTTNACAAARAAKDTIQDLIFLPLIQATLRYAYIRTKKGGDATDEEKASGYLYAASVAPIVASCSFHDAWLIMQHMDITNQAPDYTVVRDAFMNHFDCLGLKCKDIGGLWDAENNDYYYDFIPCTFDNEEMPKAAVWTISGSVAFLGLLFIICLLWRCCSRRNTKSTKKRSNRYGDDDDDDDDDDDEDEKLT